MGIGSLGINPDAYGVWVADAPSNVPWRDFLAGASAAGFEGVELGPYGYLPTDPGELSDALAEYALDLYCGYASAAFHTSEGLALGIDAVHRIAKTTKPAGAPYLMLVAHPLVVNSKRVEMTPDAWDAMVSGLLEAARVAVGEYGLEPVFHQHLGMGVETLEETERLIEDTQGELGFLLDTGQYTYVGGDPAQFVKRHGQLVTYLQLRDIDPAIYAKCIEDEATFPESCERGVYCDPGQGIVDFEQIVTEATAIGFTGPAVVERSLLGCTLSDANAAARRAATAHSAFGFGR